MVKIYHTPLLEYSIGFNGNMIYIDSQYNVSSETTVVFDLEHDYGMTKTINVKLTEGEQLQFVFCQPKGEPTIEENFEKLTHTRSLTNNGPIAQKLEIMPFLDSRCSDFKDPQNLMLGVGFRL